MMLHFGKIRGTSLRLMILIGLLIISVIPMPSSASAQNGSASVWIVRSLPTSEFGVNEAKGLAFSSTANTFLLLDGNANVTLITMGEDHVGTQVISEVQDDPLNTAFDNNSGNLFVFNHGKAELAQIKADGQGLPEVSAPATRFAVHAFGIADPQGIAFGSDDGRLFILDAGNALIVSVAPHATLGFDAEEAIRGNRVQRISLKQLGNGSLKGLAYNPSNGHFYVSDPEQKRLYELTQSGDLVTTFDLAALGINNPSAMTFAPSVDNTDDPNIYDLFVLDANAVSTQQAASSGSQIVELSLVVPMALPPGTTLLPTTLVQTIETSAWDPPSPDPAGIDYLNLPPSKGGPRLLVADSEVEEMPLWDGANVFASTTSGALLSTCSTMAFTTEPTGVGVNPSNNHIFFSTDANDTVFEVDLGADGAYCTADDTVTSTNVASLYGITDAEDVTYGNNTVFVADGVNAEVYSIPLGANGILGGGDDGPVTHFDTLALGFTDLEGIGYNPDPNPDMLFIVSTKGTEKYLGEIATSGDPQTLRAYDLALMGTGGNKRSDLTYAPGSENPLIKNIYIASRNVDNNTDPNENDGQIWEIDISTPPTTDVIFKDGFEGVNFLPPWSASKTDGGDLSTSPAAALVGTKGMQAVIDDTVTIFVTSDTPNAEPRYRARFYFDPNSITMASGNAHFILNGIMGTSTAVVRVEFRCGSGCGVSGTSYQIRGRLINDGSTWINTSWFPITDASHFIEVDWRAATAVGANNGGLTLWIDGVEKANLTTVDNDTRKIDRVRLGAVAGIDAGTTGTYYFDAFESRRETYIGP
jgi:hypothetical protein